MNNDDLQAGKKCSVLQCGAAMKINRIQQQIFRKMAQDRECGLATFLAELSDQYIGRTVTSLEQLTEEEADRWITAAYIESLE